MEGIAIGRPRETTPEPGSSTIPVFPAVLTVYGVTTLLLAQYFKYNLYPDATSYLTIAQAYARGQFWDAVNGYWSPLYCWLLAPLVAAGVDQLLAPKLLALLIGVVTLAGLRRLCRRLGLKDGTASIVLIAVVPPLVCWSLTYVTPDFLLVAVLTWYLSEVLCWSPSSGARAGLAAGALGGLAYLSKHYALPFVVSHLVISGAIHYQQYRTRSARAAIRRRVFAAILALGAVAIPWIAAMSAKYDRLTIAASGTYNWYLPATGFNVGTRTLVPPPFAGAVSAWVDPTLYAHTAASRAEPDRHANPVVPRWWGFAAAFDQLQRDAMMLERFSFLALPILGAAIVLAVRDARRDADFRFAQLTLALGLYFGGYQLVISWIEERLVWMVVPLLAVLGAFLFERLQMARRLPPTGRLVAASLLVLSFWPLPAFRLTQGLNEGREIYRTAQALERYGVQGRVATLNRYSDSLRVAFFTGSAYYGRIGPSPTVERVLAELRLHEIDFLFIWTENDQEIRAVNRELSKLFPDVTRGELRELSALDVRGITARSALQGGRVTRPD